MGAEITYYFCYMQINKVEISYEFHLVNILFFFAVVTFQSSIFLVDYMKESLHRLIVRDAFGIIAFHDAS